MGNGLTKRLDRIDAKSFTRIVIIVALAAFVFRAVRLSDSSFWLDEVLQVEVARLPLSEVWGATHYERIPLDYYFMALALRLGESEFTARLPAAILGALTVAAAGLWGRLAGGARLGLIAMGLWFAHPAAVRFATEGSQYALVLFAMTYFLAALWAIWRLGRRARLRDWVHVTIAVAFIFWSSLLGWLGGAIAGGIVTAMLLARALRSEAPWRARWFAVAGKLAGAAAVGGVLSIPVFWRYMHAPHPGFYAGFTAPSPDLVWKFFASATLGYEWMECNTDSPWALFALLIFAVTGAIASRRVRGATTFAFVGAFAVGGAILLSLIRANHWIEFRYFMPVLPFLVMAAAFGVRGFGILLSRVAGRARGDIAATTLLALLAGTCVVYVSMTPAPRPDWRGALRRIAESRPQPDTLYVIDFLDQTPVEYYARRFGLNAPVISVNRDSVRLREAIESSPGAWFVHREMWSWDQLGQLFRNTFAELPEPLEPLHLVHARQFYPWVELLSRAAEAGRVPTLGAEEDKVTLRSRRHEDLRGRGWLDAEGWGEEIMLPLAAEGGRFAAVLDRARALTIEVRGAAFRPELEPPLTLALFANDAQVGELDAVDGNHDYVFSVPVPALRERTNVFELRPSRALVPGELDANSTDQRALSFWVSKITIRIEETGP